MEFKPPIPVPLLTMLPVFLAGSIDMGSAEDWQTQAARTLVTKGYNVLNPRRDDWDSSWVQEIGNPQFYEQVQWELKGLLDLSGSAIFNFLPGSQSPVTMLEYGLMVASKPQDVVCVCPRGFWRKGNIDIVSQRYNAKVYQDLIEAIETEF